MCDVSQVANRAPEWGEHALPRRGVTRLDDAEHQAIYDMDCPDASGDIAKNRLSWRSFNAMQLHSARPFQQVPSPKEAIPYSNEALRQDLQRVRDAWDDCQATRDRNAIYGYLSAVYGLVAWWAAEGREVDRARRALRLQRLEVSDREAPYAAIIRCTADPAKADKRTRSKWSRVMRHAAAYKLDSEPWDQRVRGPFQPGVQDGKY